MINFKLLFWTESSYKGIAAGILLLLFILCQNHGSAQDSLESNVRKVAAAVEEYRLKKRIEISYDSISENYFSRGAYDKYFDKYFTQIKYERESFTEGNSAALKISDSKTNLNLNLSHKANNTIFSVGTSLNVSDNSGVLFSGNSPTAGTELFAGFSFLIPSWRFLKFNGPDQDLNYRKRHELADSLWVVHARKNPIYATQLIQKLKKEDSLFRRYDSVILDPRTPDSIRLKHKDSLLNIINVRLKTKDEISKLDIEMTNSKIYISSLIKRAIELEISKEMSTEGVTYFRMLWLTSGLSYRRDNYATYDSLLPLSSSIGSRLFDKWNLNAGLNFFWQRTDAWIDFRNFRFINSVYSSLNYTLVHTNNFENLSEITLSVNRNRVQNDTVYQISSPKKIRDISTKKFEASWLHRVNYVLTTMIGRKQFFGINMSANADFHKDRETFFTTRLGALFRFKNSGKEKSIVNFELFFLFPDISNSQNHPKNLWSRKEVGISANVPFEKVFFR